MRIGLSFILITIIFVACDPAQSFKIRNNSNDFKQIEVFLENGGYFPHNDTIEIISQKNSCKIRILKDTSRRTYSFYLPKNSYALIQQGIALQIPKRVIVDETDTILFNYNSPKLNKTSKTTLVSVEIN